MSAAPPRFLRAPAAEAHERHMDTLKGMRTAAARAEYIDGVRRAEGNFYAKWLQDDFAQWWATGRTTKETNR